jgi:hypothetical protein
MSDSNQLYRALCVLATSSPQAFAELERLVNAAAQASLQGDRLAGLETLQAARRELGAEPFWMQDIRLAQQRIEELRSATRAARRVRVDLDLSASKLAARPPESDQAASGSS